MQPKPNFFRQTFKGFRIFCISLVSLLILSGLVFGGLRFATPSNIANPKSDHYHFRFQYIYHGNAEDFSTSKYQTPYTKDICSGNLTDSPVHFHDDEDQITHVHWQGLTVGEFLKLYGVNTIGGLDDYLGFRFDQFFKFPPTLTPVPIFDHVLPKPESSDRVYLYTGDRNSFIKKDFEQFKTKTIEETTGQDSAVRKQFEANEKTSMVNPLTTIPALAHNGIDDGDGNPNEVRHSDEELKQINNFVGNIVLFVQPNEPTQDEIKVRFNNLVPLGDSVCGG